MTEHQLDDQRPKMSLYQILEIRNHIDEGLIELARDYDLEDETFDQMFFDKVDDTIDYQRDLEKQSSMIADEIADLQQQKAAIDAKAKRIAERCERAMKANNFEKLAGHKYRVFIQSRRCPPSVDLAVSSDKLTAKDRAKWPKFIKAKYELSKQEILRAWKIDPKQVPEELATIVTDKVNQTWKFERRVVTDGKGKTAGSKRASKSKSIDAAKSAAATDDGGEVSQKSGDRQGVPEGSAGTSTKSAVS